MPQTIILSPWISQCYMNSKCQGMLQDLCREQGYAQSPLLTLPKLLTHKAPSRSGCNLNKSSDGNCSPVASCSFLPGTKKWALGSGACRHCLDSIVCGLKWTSLIPVNASKLSGTSGMQRKGTHMLEKQNYKWPWTTDAKEISILKGEKS